MKRFAKRLFTGTIRKLAGIHLINRIVERCFQEWYQMPFPPTHYYSPLPYVPEITGNFARWHREEDLAGIELAGKKQDAFLESLAAYATECSTLPQFEETAFGQGYGEVEAQFLHCAIRYFQPRRIIEVGSGASTLYSLNALEANQQAAGISAAVVCIEPFPSAPLKEWAAHKKLTLRTEQVQSTELEIFSELEAGDILFIDSSHAGKIDSDVYFLLFRVLPRLRRGVVIHLHDIPFPYLTCPPDHPIFAQTVFWNEAALLQAFLMWNSRFEVLACQSYLHHRSPESLKMVAPVYDPAKHFPTGFWMRKVV